MSQIYYNKVGYSIHVSSISFVHLLHHLKRNPYLSNIPLYPSATNIPLKLSLLYLELPPVALHKVKNNGPYQERCKHHSSDQIPHTRATMKEIPVGGSSSKGTLAPRGHIAMIMWQCTCHTALKLPTGHICRYHQRSNSGLRPDKRMETPPFLRLFVSPVAETGRINRTMNLIPES